MGITTCYGSKTCLSDYISIGIIVVTSTIIASGICFIWCRRRTPEVKAKQLSLLCIQAIGCILWLISLLMIKYVTRITDLGEWFSCYLWQVWMEGPLTYCLVVSCCVARAYRLYHVFVRKHLPPIRPPRLVPLLLSPAICTAIVVQWRRPFKEDQGADRSYRYCVAGRAWWLVLCVINAGYITALAISTWFVRNIRFEFNESKELIASVASSLVFLGVWMSLLWVTLEHSTSRANVIYEEVAQYVLLFVASVAALCFAFLPVLRPLKSALGFIKKQHDLDSMGLALGYQPSDLLQPFWSFRFTEPLEALLEHKRFSTAFQEFADSRLAGETVRFYAQVSELSRMSSSNTVARLYMAQHIIETFIDAGSPMEINISHKMRSDILSTTDLTDRKLFDTAAGEAIKIIKTNLEEDFRQCPQFRALKEEMETEVEFAEQLEWMNIASKRDSFSTSDNLFDSKGSPQWPLKLGSPSPTHNRTSPVSPSTSLAPSPNADMSPEHFTIQMGSNMNRSVVQPLSMLDFQEALRHHTPHKHSLTKGNGR